MKSWIATNLDDANKNTGGSLWPPSFQSATSPSSTTTASTDAFTFVFLRDVEAGTIVNFTDNGWLAAGGFRPGEQTVTYTAPAAITAGTIVTLTGLNLDDAGDQIIAYQGDPATPTILHVVDFADGNNTVAGDATNDNTTALAARLHARRQRGRGRVRPSRSMPGRSAAPPRDCSPR